MRFVSFSGSNLSFLIKKGYWKLLLSSDLVRKRNCLNGCHTAFNPVKNDGNIAFILFQNVKNKIFNEYRTIKKDKKIHRSTQTL